MESFKKIGLSHEMGLIDTPRFRLQFTNNSRGVRQTLYTVLFLND